MINTRLKIYGTSCGISYRALGSITIFYFRFRYVWGMSTLHLFRTKEDMEGYENETARIDKTIETIKNREQAIDQINEMFLEWYEDYKKQNE